MGKKAKSKPVIEEETTTESGFSQFDLDERILKAIGELGWEKPTQVQQSLIPLALEGKNILARARTGSGKTAAFLLPIIQNVVQISSSSEEEAGPYAIFVAPTKELAAQIYKLLLQLTSPFPFLQCVNFAEMDESNVETMLGEVVDMIVSTPGRIVNAVGTKPSLLNNVRHVVLDEADLLLSFGYKDEMEKIKEALPKTYQSIFTSATLNENMDEIKAMLMTGPVVSLKLKEGQLPGSDQLTQYHINCQSDEERFTILLSLIKLKLIIGKTIVFVSTTDRCYKLSLFLQAFKIQSCILNSQMPANYRSHIIREYNEGRHQFIIASDMNDIAPKEDEAAAASDEPPTKKKKKQRKPKNGKRKMDKESGVARGIDFHFVSNVINFDFPTSTDIYIHRVGRTARGFNKGTAISFAIPTEIPLVENVHEEINEMMGEDKILPYNIRMKDFEGFQLRAREALAACTKTVIREARLAEIKQEILRSKQLEAYFSKNPREKAALENDKKLFKINLHSTSIADVPDYIVPKPLRGQNYSVKTNTAFNRNRKRKMSSGEKKKKKKNMDPLQSFKF
uniref:ATP-dependent RNA helicase n=1 Tax=Panagrolaimus sp. PS1159 TaxID=55785 RepID=A0AC35FR71_9BILA